MSPKRALFCFAGLWLLSLSPVQAAETTTVGRPVYWTTPDGVRIAGIYRGVGGPGHHLWILLHGLGSNKQEWLSFTNQLAEQGEGFLIYDARGHGDSKQGAGVALNYQDFRTIGPGSQWDRMIGDVESAVAFLKKRYSLDPSKVAIGGASLGANVAMVYASQHREVPAVILLSPGLKYAGVMPEEAFRQYAKRPVFVAASPGDTYAYSSSQQLISWRKDPACLFVAGEGSAHGVQMFNLSFTRKLLDWIKRTS